VTAVASRELRRPFFGERLWRVSLYLFCGLVFVYLLSPMLVILPMSLSSAPYLVFPPPGLSLRWYDAYLSSEQWFRATLLSIQIALGVTVLATILGTLAAVGLAQAEFQGKKTLNAFLMSPMIVPVIILAVAIYHLYARARLIGTAGGIVLAHTVLALPFVVVTVTAGLAGVDRNLVAAARTLGASAFRAFLRITLPLIAGSIFSGALFAFISSFDEVVIAIFVGGSSAITLPKQMWDGVRNEINPTITAAATVMVALSVVLLATVSLLMRRAERVRDGSTKPENRL
jgi:putative spermidine/putrescine transport system permease protein